MSMCCVVHGLMINISARDEETYSLHFYPADIVSAADVGHLNSLRWNNPTSHVNAPVDLVGSTSWIGADAYDPGDELHNRALAVLGTLNWDHLLSISSALNNGVPCTFSQKFSIGHFNMVRRIDFTDGTSWVARVRLPELPTAFGDRGVLDVARHSQGGSCQHEVLQVTVLEPRIGESC
ncbi:hypothetical protein ACKRZS_004016 [Fusarium odoratissimum]